MRLRSFVTGILVSLALACGGSSGGGGGNPPPPTPDFSVSVSAPSSIQAGSSGSTGVALTRSGGHSAAVTLTLSSPPQGITGSGSVASGSVSGTLNLSVPASATPGAYTLNVSATDGTLTRSATVNLTVTPAPDFSLSVAAPPAIQAGATGFTPVTLTRSGGHSAAVNLSLASNAQGITGNGNITAGGTSGNLALTVPLTAAPGTYTLTANATDGALSRSATFSLTVTPGPDFGFTVTPPAGVVQGGTGNATLAVTRSNGHTAALSLGLATNPQGITGSGSIAAGVNSGTLLLTVPASVAPGSYNLSATATDGTLVRTASFNLVVTAAPNFSLSATNPGTITAGSSGTSTVTAARVGGHTAAIALSIGSNPQNITGTGNILSGASTANLSVVVPAPTAAGTYTLTVNGSDGTLTRSASITVTVQAAPAQNFTLSVTPPASINNGATGATSVAANRSGGHTAAISLSIDPNPQSISGSGTISFGASSGTVSITVPAPVTPGTYTLSVTGTDGTLVRSASFSLTVTAAPTPDFSLSVAAPPSIPAGSSAGTTVTATRSGGHNTTITLSIAANGQGVTGSGTIPSGNSTGTLTLSVPGGATAGTYSLTCNGTDGTLTRTAGFSLTILPAGAVTYTIPVLYISQANQNQGFTVPLVKDRDGYLRAFVIASGANSATPTLTITIKNGGGTTVFSSVIPAPGASVPTAVDESLLSKSWNVAVPGAYIQPGYTLLATLSAGGVTWPASGTPWTFDSTRLKTVNPFRVTFWAVQTADVPTPRVGNVNAGNIGSYTSLLEQIWPINPATDRVYGGIWATSNVLLSDGTGWSPTLSALDAKRTADGATTRYYYGVVNPTYSGGVAGLGYIGWPAAIGWDKLSGYSDSGLMSGVYAHEVGHNFGIQHAPCGGPAGPDPGYPYSGGFIGTWGIDVGSATLKSPSTYHDIMGYCSTVWVSDYNFKNVVLNRSGGTLEAAPPDPEGPSATGPRSLLLWGRLDDGVATLEPAFHMAVDAQVPEGGDQVLEGLDASGRRIFSRSFGLREVGCLEPGRARHFSFSVPLSPAEALRLHELRWTKAGELLARQGSTATARTGGPSMEPLMQPMFDGRTRLLWDAAAEPAVMVRDKATGLVIGLGQGGELRLNTEADEVELQFSDGVRSRTVIQKRPKYER
ncbi:MAG: hypothetical protein HY823_08525 [Acidobacteria bacterium]|nr:hypothetical protein [Acidobacteriota bacterium]